MDTGLAHRRVLVTGAGGGIGQAICRALARERAVPLVHYRNSAEKARGLREEIQSETGIEAELYRADLSDEGSVERMFRQIEAAGPATDLVANAAIYPEGAAPLRDMTLDRWNRTMSVNLGGTFLTCRGFLRGIVELGIEDPALVLISSTAAVFGEEDFADYSASKAALRGLCLTLKNEIVRHAERGRCNTICPGWVATPMARASLAVPGAIERVTRTMALRKVATPEDVAGTTLFLLSGVLAGHLSGSTVTVAGGMEGRILHDG